MLEYEINAQWQEVFNSVDEIGKILRTDAITKNFNPRAEYGRLLTIACGCYVYLVTEYKRWRAIKENNEVNKYVMLKNDPTLTAKFVSATADRESSAFVSKERYYRDILEGYTLACEAIINTLKKFIDSDKKEEKYT